jgi:uncharacterized protein YcbK (DUF882 family)
MRILTKRGLLAAILALILMGSGSIAKAKDAETSVGGSELYHLRMHHLHTGESIDVVYRVGDTYLPNAIAKLNYFLRDHRTQNESDYDPKEFDLLHALMARLGRPDGVIDIVCGYRTPWSNNLLRSRSANSGVAEHSQHMLAKAIDIRVPGVATAKLRDTALSLHAGGVGYYPVSQFVHVDVGPVREWQYGRARRVRTRSVARSTRHVPRHRASTIASGE